MHLLLTILLSLLLPQDPSAHDIAILRALVRDAQKAVNNWPMPSTVYTAPVIVQPFVADEIETTSIPQKGR